MTRWVLATRGEGELAELREALAPRGISVVAHPVLAEVDRDDAAAWDLVAARREHLRAVVFTSRRAPEALRRSALRSGREDLLAGVPAAAVGRTTAAAATHAGFAVDTVGAGGAGSLAEALIARLADGDVVVHACGREHRAELAEILKRHAIETLPLEVYAMAPTPVELLPALPDSPPLAVLLTSPRAAGAYFVATAARFASAPHLAIGPTTAAAARALGLVAVHAVTSPQPNAIVEELCRIS